MAEEKKQKRLFKLKRAGIVLTENQVKEIKAGRKKLRAEMRARGIKSKQEFEIVAGSMGLYFDKRDGLLLWLLHGRGLWALLGATLLLLGVFFLMSLISQMRGYFTINLSDGMFKEGFVLSETEDFANPSVNLYCEPAVDVPCVSITMIDDDVDEIDGQHNADYFAYTFYCRNEGDTIVDYIWELELNDESKDLSTAAWVMVFEDGEMRFYAEQTADGGSEALPAFNDDSRGYSEAPFLSLAAEPDKQFEVVGQRGDMVYYRVIPERFLSERSVAEGRQNSVKPQDVHKYTVVIWLEGDDPDCDNSKIGGHLGLDMQFRLVEEDENRSSDRFSWLDLWKGLKFWEN